MSWKQFLAILGALILIMIVLFLAVPGSNVVLHNFLRGTKTVLRISWGILLFVMIIVLPWVLGPVTRAPLLRWADDHLSPLQELSIFQTILLSIVFASICGVGWLLAIPFLAAENNWLYKAFIGLGWNGVYETAPLGWAIYTFCAFILSFWISYWVSDY